MNVNDKKTIVYSRNTVEFVTVAAEFCAYLEQSEGRKCRDFTDTVLKLLPLLYLKAALLEDIEGAEDFLPEAFVSEQDYEFVRLTLSALLGEKDDYLDFCNEGVKFSDEPAVKNNFRGFGGYLSGIEELCGDLPHRFGGKHVRGRGGSPERVRAVLGANVDECHAGSPSCQVQSRRR